MKDKTVLIKSYKKLQIKVLRSLEKEPEMENLNSLDRALLNKSFKMQKTKDMEKHQELDNYLTNLEKFKDKIPLNKLLKML